MNCECYEQDKQWEIVAMRERMEWTQRGRDGKGMRKMRGDIFYSIIKKRKME